MRGLVAILLATLVLPWTAAVTRQDDTPDGHLLASHTVEQAKAALAEGADINTRDDLNGQTPLMRSTLHGWSSMVAYLLEQGADITVGEKDGYTAPHGAAFQGRVKILSILKDHGVDIFSAAEKDDFTPFHRACWGREERHTETIRYLLEQGADVNLKGGPERRTCLQMTPNPKTKALLLEWGAGHQEL